MDNPTNTFQDSLLGIPPIEVEPRAKRRQFTAANKRRIVAEAETVCGAGAVRCIAAPHNGPLVVARNRLAYNALFAWVRSGICAKRHFGVTKLFAASSQRSAAPLVRYSCMGPRKIIVITAPSGAGKTTLARIMLAAFPQMRFSVSVTTRAPRPTEEDGTDYHFVTVDEFQHLIREDQFAEYEEVYPGTYYGTLRFELERASKEEPVLLDIDVKGAMRLREHYGDEALTIFIRPPSFAELEERLRDRATESNESLQTRLQRAKEEMRYRNTFHVDVINNELQNSVPAMAMMIQAYLQL